MRRISRLPLFIALIFVLLTAGCGEATPIYIGTLLPTNSDLTSTPMAPTEPGTVATAETSTTSGLDPATVSAVGVGTQLVGTQVSGAGTTQTPGIPVTGRDIMLVECQFCVDTQAHALLVLPDTATFKIVSPAAASTATQPAPSCETVEVNNGKQVVLCSGAEMTPLVVNICTDANTCTDFPVDLLACPLTQGASVGNVNATPDQTQAGPTIVVGTLVSPTLNPGVVISTATPLAGAVTTTPTP